MKTTVVGQSRTVDTLCGFPHSQRSKPHSYSRYSATTQPGLSTSKASAVHHSPLHVPLLRLRPCCCCFAASRSVAQSTLCSDQTEMTIFPRSCSVHQSAPAVGAAIKVVLFRYCAAAGQNTAWSITASIHSVLVACTLSRQGCGSVCRVEERDAERESGPGRGIEIEGMCFFVQIYCSGGECRAACSWNAITQPHPPSLFLPSLASLLWQQRPAECGSRRSPGCFSESYPSSPPPPSRMIYRL